jgi:WD40 repeat protein
VTRFWVSTSFNAVRFWDLATLQATGELSSSEGWRAVAFNPDGSLLVAVGHYSPDLWEVRSRAWQGVIQDLRIESSWDVAFAPDGTWFVTADTGGSAMVYRIVDRDGRQRFKTDRGAPGGSGSTTGVAVHPAGTHLAMAATDGLRVWKLNSGDSDVLLSGAHLDDAAFSPDGQLLVCCGPDGIRLFDFGDGTKAGGGLWIASAAARRLAFNPDGRTFATVGLDGTVSLWTLPAHR